jgi:hypothetical protein
MARLAAVLAVVGLALLASGAASPREVQGAGCPRAALPLSGSNPIGPAATAALGRVPAADRPQVTTARIAIYDDNRGAQVKTQCGRRALTRTVVVYVARRAYWPA